ncbi:membrane protein [Halalkalibacter wakoensis JCM 9140]|uniref:Membrane protein n=2 Tax=Halalkalibacter wakoensis TaxID=127891 RepID=W4Q8R6_9BACI|nr:membrane protein [Halalkalibacter wakoensis JCM 9140]
MPLFQSPQLIADMYMIPQQLSESDKWIRIFLDVFIENKFFTIFSFLFGLGFYIFMNRAEGKGKRFYRLYIRRLTLLALFGLMHLVFLWYGDILLNYALAGFLLLFFYKRKAQTILIVIITFTLALIILLSLNFFSSPEELKLEIQMLQVEGAGKMEEAVEQYQNSSYLELMSYRFSNEVIPVLKDLPFSMLTAWYMFLIGLYTGKRNIISHFHSHRNLVKRVWWISLLCSIPISILIIALHLNFLKFGIHNEIFIQVFVTFSGLSLSLFYLSTILFLLQKDKWRKRLNPFSYIGRMALTNYIMQTFIGVGIFTGLGLFGDVNLTLGIILSLIIFPIQILFSYLWLKYYKYGPLEWLWRSITYGEFQTLKMRK